MTVNAGDVRRLFEAAWDDIKDPGILAAATPWIVEPFCEMRPWGYADAVYSCWFVLADKVSNVGIAYCEHGFGPSTPWGLLWLSGKHRFMGDDSGWFRSLADAIRDAWPRLVTSCPPA